MKTYDEMAANINAIEKMGNWVAKSQMFGCGSPEQGCVIVMDCFMTGMPIMEYQKRNMLVSGRPSIPYDAMIAAFQEAGGRLKLIEKSPFAGRVELTFQGNTTPFAFTWEEALKEPLPYNGKEKDVVAMLEAGKKPALKSKYATPRSRAVMLFARVVSDGIRTVAASVNFGRYTPEEISDFDEVQPATVPTVAGDAAATVVQPSSVVSPSPASSPIVQQDTQPATTPLNQPSDETVIHETSPATEDQKKEIVGLMSEIHRLGDTGIVDRVKNKLAASGIQGGILGLTVSEAKQLRTALQQKNLDVWVTLALQGHASATRQSGN